MTDPLPMEFTTPERVVETTPFILDGENLTAIKPKGGQLLSLVRDVRLLGTDDQLAQAEVVDRFMDMCMDHETASRLQARLFDAEDAFDLDTLTLIIQRLQEVWGDRPTGPSKPSSGRRRTTGRASTGRAR